MMTATKTLIVRYTANEDLTAMELADMLGIAKRNVNQNLKHLIEAGEVKIVGYQMNSPGYPSPRYSSNKFRRCQKYEPLSDSEVAKRYREKNAWKLRARNGKQIMGVTV